MTETQFNYLFMVVAGIILALFFVLDRCIKHSVERKNREKVVENACVRVERKTVEASGGYGTGMSTSSFVYFKHKPSDSICLYSVARSDFMKFQVGVEFLARIERNSVDCRVLKVISKCLE